MYEYPVPHRCNGIREEVNGNMRPPQTAASPRHAQFIGIIVANSIYVVVVVVVAVVVEVLSRARSVVRLHTVNQVQRNEYTNVQTSISSNRVERGNKINCKVQSPV